MVKNTVNDGDVERGCSADVALFMRRLYMRGLTTTSGGNISCRPYPGKDMFLITPSGSDKGRMRSSEVGMVDVDGRVVSKNFKPSIETSAHIRIYLARKDIAAVVHAHPPYASAIASTTATVNTRLLAESRAILGDVAYVDNHLMGSSKLAEALSFAFATANCAIMRNHGAIAAGSSLLEAFDRLEVLEAAAFLTVTTLSALKPWISEISDSALLEIDEMMKGKNQRCLNGG